MNTRVGATLENLRREVFEGDKKILFITGAGLSFDSGIPLFRSESDGDETAIWNSRLEAWATMECFKKNPEEWYAEFFNQFSYWSSFISAKPNRGHEILSSLCVEHSERIKVITQNIDGLMQASGCPEENIIEVHGRIDRLRCSNPRCEYSSKKYVNIDWSSLVNSKKIKKNFYKDWICSACGHKLLPLFLLFDETYTSHSYYQWEKAQAWMNEADIMVFIGTSFSVLCTDCCLFYAHKNKVPIYNVNIRPCKISFELDAGPCGGCQVLEYPHNLTHNITRTSTDFLNALYNGTN